MPTIVQDSFYSWIVDGVRMVWDKKESFYSRLRKRGITCANVFDSNGHNIGTISF